MNSINSDSVDTSRFPLKSNYILMKPIHKIDFIKYSPSSLATVSNANSNMPTRQEKMHTNVYQTHTSHWNLKFLKIMIQDMLNAMK